MTAVALTKLHLAALLILGYQHHWKHRGISPFHGAECFSPLMFSQKIGKARPEGKAPNIKVETLGDLTECIAVLAEAQVAQRRRKPMAGSSGNP